MNEEMRNDRYSTAPEGRDPEAIQEDIARTRSDMDETLDEIQQRLSPGQMVDQARTYLRSNTGGGREFMDNLRESVRRNPVPMALIGIGVGWLMLSGRKGYSNPHAQQPYRAGALNEDAPEAEVRDDVERRGVTAEDREARSQPPNSALPRGL